MGEERFCIPKRYIFTALGSMGLFNIYAMRISLSVAIVAMVNSTSKVFSNSTSDVVIECPNLISKTQDITVKKFIGSQYNWDAQIQGLILGAFYYVYVLTQIPGGYLTEKIGAKWLFGGGILNTAIFNLITPFIVSWGWIAFVIVRIIQGFGESATFPAINLMISHWSPKMERSRISTIIFSGIQMGTVLSMPIAGWLSSSELFGGWPSVFYLLGAVSCIWFVLWAFLVSETPDVHPTISAKELQCFKEDQVEKSQNKPKPPYKAIFTSLPFWAVIVAHFGTDLLFLLFLSELPTYFSTVLHLNLEENGLLSALPFVFQAIVAWTSSYGADRLRQSNTFSITNIRKIFNTVGSIGPALCILGITISGCRPYLIIFLVTLGMSLIGFVYSGFNITHVDMSPTFAGTLYAITNAIASLGGFIGPALVGVFIKREATIANWNNVFYITAGINVFCAAFFIAFASAELQPWNSGKDSSMELK